MKNLILFTSLSLMIVSCKKSMQEQCEVALKNKYPDAELVEVKEPRPLSGIKLDAGIYEDKTKNIVTIYYKMEEQEREGMGICYFDSDDNILNPNLESERK